MCCALIDLVANSLKFALNLTENKHELDNVKTGERDDQLETQSIEELYRKIHVNNKINLADGDETPKRSVISLHIDTRSILFYVYKIG